VGNNKQFDNILDECLERLITGQETVEQCLQRYPEYANELEPLLRTAVLMNKAVDVKPSADFRARARYQMQLKMAESKAPQRVTRVVPRWAIAACTAMFVFVLGGSTVFASAGVMPGNPLYAVKLAAENVQVKFAGSDQTRVELYVAMADQRVNEMVWMASNNKTQNIEAAAQRLDSYYNTIGTLPLPKDTELSWSLADNANQSNSAPAFTSAAPTTTKPMVITPDTTKLASGATDKNAVTTTAATTTNAVIAPVPTIALPPDTNNVITTTVVTAKQTANSLQRGDIFHGTGNQSNTGNPASANGGSNSNASNSSQLLNTLLYNSISQTDKIQQLLDSNNVPESVKPALRRALAASKIGFSNAISNFVSP